MMMHDHKDAASKINDEIERLVRKLDDMNPARDSKTYFEIAQSVKELAIASATLVPPGLEN